MKVNRSCPLIFFSKAQILSNARWSYLISVDAGIGEHAFQRDKAREGTDVEVLETGSSELQTAELVHQGVLQDKQGVFVTL